MVRIFQLFVKIYSYVISPFIGRNCRFHPTCSCYMHEALGRHGVLKGMILGLKRILSCHPWNKKDFHDPVPKRFAWKEFLGYKRSQENNNNKPITTTVSD